MKTRAFALTIGAILLCAAALAGAQVDNCCYVDRQCHTNQDWINGWHAYQNGQCQAPAQSGTTGGAQIDNCCYVDRQCHSNQDWINGWHAYQNGQCGAPAPSRPTGGAQIDNCCHVDRQCHSNQDWINGWHAWRHNQCGASGQVPTSFQSAIRIIKRTSSGVVIGRAGGRGILPSTSNNFQPARGQIYSWDNCCDRIWQCNSDRDRAEGYRALQNDQCALPGLISIVGDPNFVSYYEQRLNELKNRLPHRYRYDYVLNGLDKIEQRRNGRRSSVDVGDRTFYKSWNGPSVNGWDRRDSAVLVHEACHVHRYEAGFTVGECDDAGFTREEVICREMELQVLIELAAQPHIIEWSRGSLARTRAGIKTVKTGC